MKGTVVITGGGTGGHIFPMRAIADALARDGVSPEDIHLVGSRRGQERRLLSDSGYPLTLLPGRGLQRSLSPGAIVRNAGAVAGLVAAVVRAAILVARWRPAVVVSVGGYASVATGLAAALWRRPLVLVELDAQPGATHRLLSRFARRRCLSTGVSAGRDVVTGTPVSDVIATLDRSSTARRAARMAFDPPLDPNRDVVVVMTGSLGSRRVNDAISALAARWCDRESLALLHVTGRRDAERIRAARPATGGLDYRIFDFADMAPLWAVADAAVCRAGAMTTAELTALGIPAVLVPLPGAPGDHQTANARALVSAGAAIMVSDADCDAARLGAALDELLEPAALDARSRASAALGRTDGAAAIAAVVRDAAEGR